MTADKDFYGLLEVSPSADLYEIQTAYAHLTARYQGELADSPQERQEAFSSINEAYSVLASPDRRSAYDREIGIARASRLPVAPPPEWATLEGHRRDAEARNGGGFWKGCSLVVVAVVGLAAIAGVWFSAQCREAVNGADRTATLYLTAISAGNYQVAYDLNCQNVKDSMTYDAFRTKIAANRDYFDGYQGHELAGAELTVPQNGPRTVLYQATVRYDDGSSGGFEGLFAKQGESWCIIEVQMAR
jgi:curved DNA-binding protein CbpA